MAFGSDVDITVGADTSQFAAGMATLRNEASLVGSSLAGILSPAGLIVTALTVGAKSVVDYGQRIFELGKRFDVSTTELQQFGNAAERNGVSLEQLAKAFNRLDVALAQARAGSKEMQAALVALNVNDWADRSITLSHAMIEIGTSAMEANSALKVLGREGTAMRETLRSLADGSEQLGSAIDPATIEKLHKFSETMKMIGQESKIAGANFITFFIDPIKKGADDINNAFDHMAHGAKLIGRGSFLEGAKEFFTGQAPQGHPPGPKNVPTNETMVPTSEDLKLLNEEQDIEDNIADDAERWAAASAKAIDKAKEGAAEEEQIIAGHQNIATLMRIEFDFQQKINDAYNAGDKELAYRLGIEEKLTLEAEKQKQAEQDARDAAAGRDAAATQIRDAAGALLHYNLRVGEASDFPVTFAAGGRTGTLTGPALGLFQQIQSLGAGLSAPNLTGQQIGYTSARIEALIPLFQQQIQILLRIDKHLTPAPGGI
jgi:hypothetical protein